MNLPIPGIKNFTELLGGFRNQYEVWEVRPAVKDIIVDIRDERRINSTKQPYTVLFVKHMDTRMIDVSL